MGATALNISLSNEHSLNGADKSKSTFDKPAIAIPIPFIYMVNTLLFTNTFNKNLKSFTEILGLSLTNRFMAINKRCSFLNIYTSCKDFKNTGSN